MTTRSVQTITLMISAVIIMHCQSAFASNQTATKVYETAKKCLGAEMWKPGYGLSKGTLGCAAAVSNVLKKAGVTRISSAMVTVMRRQILASSPHCQELIIRNGQGTAIDDSILLKNCRPGDVLVAFMEPPTKMNGGPNAHCGIMGQGTHVYTNDWNNGIWSEVEIHQMFDTYPFVRLLRLN